MVLELGVVDLGLLEDEFEELQFLRFAADVLRGFRRRFVSGRFD